MRKRKKFKRLVSLLLTCVLAFGSTELMRTESEACLPSSRTFNVNTTVNAGGSSSFLPLDREIHMIANTNVTFNFTITPTPSNVAINISFVLVDVSNGIQGLYHNHRTATTINQSVQVTRSGVYRLQIRNYSSASNRVTGTFTCAQRVCDRSIRVRHDSSYSGGNNTIITSFNNARSRINDVFDIRFPAVTAANIALDDIRLNGRQNGAAGCLRNNNIRCGTAGNYPPGFGNNNPNCGIALINCNGRHHRSAERLLNSIINQYAHHSVYTMGVVGHALCFWDDGFHDPVGGVAFRSVPNQFEDRESLVTTSWHEGLAFLMQHELSHNLGASHARCQWTFTNGVRCSIDGPESDIGVWCANCTRDIHAYKVAYRH
jgi:hypothetical protein